MESIDGLKSTADLKSTRRHPYVASGIKHLSLAGRDRIHFAAFGWERSGCSTHDPLRERAPR